MEPVTHLLTGAVLARSGFNRKTALATAVMALAAEAADLDVACYLDGSVTGFIQHRGITHTVWAIPFMAAISVGLIYLWMKLWDRIRPPKIDLQDGPPRRWGLLFFFACIAASTHLLLDFTNNYGVRPLWPLDRHWYAWDIVYIVEPVMLVILVAALLLPMLFSLINSEIGVRRHGARGRGLAIAALIAIVSLWGFRDHEHRKALKQLDLVNLQGATSLRTAAFPALANPFAWSGVIETSDAYRLLPLDTRAARPDPFASQRIYYKPEETPETLATRNSRLGRAYLEWARFPLLVTERHEAPLTGATVCLRDLRFQPIGERRKYYPLQACVELDSQQHVQKEAFTGRSGD
jgi:inner membrane protein